MIGKDNRKRAAAIALPILAGLVGFAGASMAQTPDLGVGASLHGKRLLPADNPWNQDISQLPVDPNSTNILTSIGLTTGLHPDFGTSNIGIPYIVVPGS